MEQEPQAKVLRLDIAPSIRHINRVRRGVQWLGPAIPLPKYILEGVPQIGPKPDYPEIVA